MTPERVKQIRLSLGLSQAELAKSLRMAQNGARTIRHWETGKRGITGPASVALEYMAACGQLDDAEKSGILKS